MAASMEDVAKRAGVSKSTVSLVLNNKAGTSPEIQQMVLKAAEDLGYRLPERDPEKHTLKGKTITIVHSVDRQAGETSEIQGLYLKYLNGIRAFVQQKNVHMTLIASYHEDDETHLGFQLLSDETHSPDGLILMGRGARKNSQLIQRLVKERIPAVVLSRNWPDLPISTVSQDHHQQARIALDHLIRLGHRRIAFLAAEADRENDWFEWRLSCYQAVMTQLEGQVDETLLAVGLNGAEAAKILMARRPDVTAIFAVNDSVAIEAINELQQLGLAVPGDVSVIGLDGTVLSGENIPALATVAFPHFDVGYLAAELLLKQIKNHKLYYAHVLLRSTLVEGASCAEPHSE